MLLRVRTLLVSAAVVFIGVPGFAVTATASGGGVDDDAQMVADAMRTESAVFAAYNDKKWDELRAMYTDDAVALPPNHEPIRGQDAIVEYLRGVRDVYGPIDGRCCEHVRVRGSGKLADLVSNFTVKSGSVRVIGEALYERQPDGTVLLGVDQFGFRDQTTG